MIALANSLQTVVSEGGLPGIDQPSGGLSRSINLGPLSIGLGGDTVGFFPGLRILPASTPEPGPGPSRLPTTAEPDDVDRRDVVPIELDSSLPVTVGGVIIDTVAAVIATITGGDNVHWRQQANGRWEITHPDFNNGQPLGEFSLSGAEQLSADLGIAAPGTTNTSTNTNTTVDTSAEETTDDPADATAADDGGGDSGVNVIVTTDTSAILDRINELFNGLDFGDSVPEFDQLPDAVADAVDAIATDTGSTTVPVQLTDFVMVRRLPDGSVDCGPLCWLIALMGGSVGLSLAS